jgi:hypothetical protein
MRSTINFMDAENQTNKLQNENSMHLKFLSHQMEIDNQGLPFSFLVLKQGIKKVKLLQVIGCITTGLDQERHSLS